MSIDLESVIQTAVDEATAEPEGGAESVVEETVVEEPIVEEPVVEEPAIVDPPAAVVEPAKEAAKVEDDAFAKEHGIKAKDKSGRENKIPYSAVVRINTNAVKKARTAWEAEALVPVTAKVTAYEERLARVGETETIMFGDPERFLQMLATSVPGYAKLLARGAAEAKAEIIDPTNVEPGPDMKDEKGNALGYSAEGLAKLRAWDREQAVKLAEERLAKRYKPIEEAFTSHQAGAKQAESVNAQLDEGAKWPGFAENADAILKALTDDYAANPRAPKLRNLREAYDSVVFPKLKFDEAAIETRLRAKILDELKRAPRSTSAGGSAAVSAAERAAGTAGTGDAVEDAIYASIKGLK